LCITQVFNATGWVLIDGRVTAARDRGKCSARRLAVGVAAAQREWTWRANAVGMPLILH